MKNKAVKSIIVIDDKFFSEKDLSEYHMLQPNDVGTSRLKLVERIFIKTDQDINIFPVSQVRSYGISVHI